MINENPNYYATIPANVRYDKSLPDGAKLLYGEITALSNKEGFCWATNEYFSKLYETSDRTISRWVSALSDAGHISIIVDQKSGNVRKIRISAAGGIDKNVVRGIDKNVHRSRQKRREGIDKNVYHNNTINNTSNNISLSQGAKIENADLLNSQMGNADFVQKEKKENHPQVPPAPLKESIVSALSDDYRIKEQFIRRGCPGDKFQEYVTWFADEMDTLNERHPNRNNMLNHFWNWSVSRFQIAQRTQKATAQTPQYQQQPKLRTNALGGDLSKYTPESAKWGTPKASK